MGYTIAIAGKGGTGKTTVASLLIRIIKEKKIGSILAVDADPNSNLAENLGVGPGETIGEIIDDIKAHPEKIPQGMLKTRFIEYKVQQSIQEKDGFDILTMGRPEGAGCYCYANNVLRNIMSKLVSDYDYVIIDNEAGLEHLSRRTTRSADVLLVVSDTTTVSLKAAGRIAAMINELDIKIKDTFLIINHIHKTSEKEKIENSAFCKIGDVPFDEKLLKSSVNGGSLLQLTNSAGSIKALGEIIDKIIM